MANKFIILHFKCGNKQMYSSSILEAHRLVINEALNCKVSKLEYPIKIEMPNFEI